MREWSTGRKRKRGRKHGSSWLNHLKQVTWLGTGRTAARGNKTTARLRASWVEQSAPVAWKQVCAVRRHERGQTTPGWARAVYSRPTGSGLVFFVLFVFWSGQITNLILIRPPDFKQGGKQPPSLAQSGIWSGSVLVWFIAFGSPVRNRKKPSY